MFTLSDGCPIALDYYPANFNDLDWPVLVVLPGLNGGSGDSYVGYTALEAQKLKFRSVIYNRRGFEGVKMKGEHIFSWTRLEDFDEVLEHIVKKSPESKIYTIGFSMGANFTQFYLGEKGKEGKATPIRASVAVSPPHNLMKGSHKVDSSKLVRQALLKYCLEIIHSQKDSETMVKKAAEHDFDYAHLDNVKTMRQLDTVFTAKFLGLPDCDAYYNSISGCHRLEHLKTPLLAISSKHDPVVEHEGLEFDKVLDNDFIFQVVVNNGGHVEYAHGWCNDNWAVLVGLDYLNQFNQGKIQSI